MKKQLTKKSLTEWLMAFLIALSLFVIFQGVSYADLTPADLKTQIKDNAGSGGWIQYSLAAGALVVGAFTAHKSLILGIGIVATVWGLITVFNAGLIG